jgi:hypothetical protein
LLFKFRKLEEQLYRVLSCRQTSLPSLAAVFPDYLAALSNLLYESVRAMALDLDQ